MADAEAVTITERIAACRDPTDDKFLELAANGRADLIVSGDNDLLVLSPFRGVRIVSPLYLRSRRVTVMNALLPVWAQILLLVMQALAVPVIAAVGAWVAIQQMRIARVKLQHDLYDRRYAVFQAARTLLAEVITSRDASDEAFRAFSIGTADAAFLFDDSLSTYLKAIHDRAAKLHSISQVLPTLPVGDEKASAVRVSGEHFLWLNDQIAVLTGKFRPFLRLDNGH